MSEAIRNQNLTPLPAIDAPTRAGLVARNQFILHREDPGPSDFKTFVEYLILLNGGFISPDGTRTSKIQVNGLKWGRDMTFSLSTSPKETKVSIDTIIKPLPHPDAVMNITAVYSKDGLVIHGDATGIEREEKPISLKDCMTLTHMAYTEQSRTI